MGKKKDRSVLVISLLFAVFAVIQCSTFIMAGDDFWWVSIPSVDYLFGQLDINGRYLTNVITYYITLYPLLRPVICIPFFIALYCYIAKVLIRGRKDRFLAYTYSAISLLITPPAIGILTTNWISGFTNYVISIFFSLIYVSYCIPMLEGRQIKGPVFLAVPVLILGFISSFCVENISLYNVCIGAFFVVYPLIRFRKVHISNICFLIGSAAGLFIMLQDKNYSQIIDSSDSTGFRAVEIDFSNIAMTFYVDLLPFISRMFFVCHIVMTFSIMVLYFRKYKSLKGKDVPKYARLFLTVICVYTFYTVFTAIFFSFTSLTPAFRMNAIEVAFAFLDLFALIYMSYVLLDRNRFTRVLFFILSVVLVTAPFLVVKPVTPRCFFATYVFWVLTSGEFLLTAFRSRKKSESYPVRFALLSLTGSLVVFLSIVNLTNYFVDKFRVDYIRDQFSSGSRTIELISLPYDGYSCDSINDVKGNESDMIFYIDEKAFSYQQFMLDYWGITEDVSDKKFITISIRDYFTAHEDE